MTGRAFAISSTWNAGTVPRCFTSADDWQEWVAMRQGAHSPCEDCSSAYKSRMLAAGRCERPETVFVVTDEGEEVGISGDDPRFARLLMGLAVSSARLLRPIEPTPAFLRLLERVKRRARLGIRRAIDLYILRERRAADVGDGK